MVANIPMNKEQSGYNEKKRGTDIDVTNVILRHEIYLGDTVDTHVYSSNRTPME